MPARAASWAPLARRSSNPSRRGTARDLWGDDVGAYSRDAALSGAKSQPRAWRICPNPAARRNRFKLTPPFSRRECPISEVPCRKWGVRERKALSCLDRELVVTELLFEGIEQRSCVRFGLKED